MVDKIDVHGLTEEEVALLQRIVDLLRGDVKEDEKMEDEEKVEGSRSLKPHSRE